MIVLRREGERRHVRRGPRDLWQTFHREPCVGQRVAEFGALAALDEVCLAPGGSSPRDAHREAEVVTYVHRAALAQEDSSGGSWVLHAGEFQHMTLGRGVRRKETNPSRSEPARLFRISLRPSEAGLATSHEERRFPAAQRHNRLCVVASPDGRAGSLRTLQDVVICSSVLDPGHHLIHELSRARGAWLHVISGEATFRDIVLVTGDGVGVREELSVSLTARESSEVLLIDLGGALSQRKARDGHEEDHEDE